MIDLPSDRQPHDVVVGEQCPYCGGTPTYVDSAVIYGRSYGMMYWCELCDAYVGTHKEGKNKGSALGRLANKELRAWKQRAHAKFDALWRMSRKKHARKNAYAWLQNAMGLPRSRTHIGMFNVAQCKRVVDLCDELVKNLSRPKV